MSGKIEEPLKNGYCEKCQWHIEDRYCEAYTFSSHLAYCEFVSCCEMFKAPEEEA